MYFVITPLKFVDVVVVIIGYFWIFRRQTKYMPLIFPLKGRGQASTSFSSCTMRYLTSIPHENMVKNNTNISPETVSYFDSLARRRRLILTIFVKNVLGLKIQFNESVIHLSQISWRLVMCMVYPLCYVLVCCFHYLYFSCLICFSLILPLSLSLTFLTLFYLKPLISLSRLSGDLFLPPWFATNSSPCSTRPAKVL